MRWQLFAVYEGNLCRMSIFLTISQNGSRDLTIFSLENLADETVCYEPIFNFKIENH